jgi:peptide deformylase
VLAIRLYGDSILQRKADPVTRVTAELRALADGMVAAMRQEDGVGLSAPQVGVLQRLVVVTRDPDDEAVETMAMVNPVVEEAFGEWVAEEGCLSLPDLYADVARPETVAVSATDLDGRDMAFTADEWFGRTILHEIDHLNGVLLIDHLGRFERARLRGQLNRIKRRAREAMEGLG